MARDKDIYWKYQRTARRISITDYFFNAIKKEDSILYNSIIKKASKNFSDGVDLIVANEHYIKRILDNDSEINGDWLSYLFEKNGEYYFATNVLKIKMSQQPSFETEVIEKEVTKQERKYQIEEQEEIQKQFILSNKGQRKIMRDRKTGRFVKWKNEKQN